jgi:glucokinase
MIKDEALKLALEKIATVNAMDYEYQAWAREALRENAMREVQRLGQEIEQEPVVILPDGSAFGVMSFPLPDDHWLYAPNEYKDGEYEPIDLPKPILTHALSDAVVAAVRYAVRGATMRGQETDFDPDALVQNAVYALCGPYAAPPQRTWVDLTDEEYTHITDTVFHTGQGLVAYYKAIEAKLKEKNT